MQVLPYRNLLSLYTRKLCKPSGNCCELLLAQKQLKVFVVVLFSDGFFCVLFLSESYLTLFNFCLPFLF